MKRHTLIAVSLSAMALLALGVIAHADPLADRPASPFERGEIFFRNRRYGDARVVFEKIVTADPYQTEAIAYLRRINGELRRIEKERGGRYVESGGVRWRYSTHTATRTKAGIAAFIARLETITISRLALADASVSDALAELKRLARQGDPEGEGANILLQVGDGNGDRPLGHVTLDLADSCLLDAIDRVCAGAGWKWGLTDQAILITEGTHTQEGTDPP